MMTLVDVISIGLDSKTLELMHSADRIQLTTVTSISDG